MTTNLGGVVRNFASLTFFGFWPLLLLSFSTEVCAAQAAGPAQALSVVG